MEHDSLHKGIRDIRNIRLSVEEKRAVLVRLLAHIRKNQPVVSPWKVFISGFNFRYMTAGAVVILLGGSSVAVAAEGSLPGDLLYPVKTAITEPLRGALLAGDVPKARWEAEKTVRRFEEAESLTAQGRLTESSAQVVADNLKKSTDAFHTIVQRKEAETPSEELVEATVEFEAQVSKHAQILLVVEEGTENETEETRDVKDKEKILPQQASHATTSWQRDEKRKKLLEAKVRSIKTIIDATENHLQDRTKTKKKISDD